ncbi:ABC transporter permease [Facklamia sp. 7083-14-GEN3]|uniref:ABC transporter permease n=1 Tax=Facklamia sp. 7083-14-GEN3 TaxID=2973478 RepID=UPI00215BC968|nr:ABC transporter permease subunit [Facklamia sp. 7083-14-GEN3]MCR8968563.1 ABC transporter permease subunit [Facklamia sp. 7083-14-GEN3]
MELTKKFYAVLLFMPQLILSLFLLLGVMIGIVQSFGYIPSLNLNEFSLVYYQDLLSNKQFSQSVFFSLKIALYSAFISTIIGLAWAYFWLIQEKLSRWQRMMVKIPIIVPHLVVALFILQLFGRTGIFARILFAVGFKNAQNWFDSLVFQPNGWGIIFSFMWKEIPFVLFYCYPIISSINRKLGEAAQTLGANRMQSFIKIVLPLSKSTILAAFFIIFMYTFGSYELPALLGPTLPKGLPVAAYQAYIHPDLSQRPLAMAYNGILLLVSLLAAAIIYLMAFYSQLKNYYPLKKR